jgi:subtilisin family serine protease
VEDTRPVRVSSPWAVLARHPDVLWAEPNGRVHALGIIPNDNYYQAQQWNLRQIGLPQAWVFTKGEAGPIAVIDTGVDLDHPDLAAKLWINQGEIPGNGLDDDENGYPDDVYGWNFVPSPDGNPNADDDHGHGSHVAGIAAARTNNGVGVAGVAWQSPIMPLKALDRTGGGWWADVIEAVVYAADNGASILNFSLGQSSDDPDVPVEAIQDAVSYARSRGCLLAAAAGNSTSQPAPVMYPAALPGVLAVAATSYGDLPWSGSNRGPEVDVAAPGVDIFSTGRFGAYYVSDGTSMATPHVSGIAALIWSLEPAFSVDQVTHVITSTAQDVYTPGWDPRTGWGRVDAQAAVLELVQPEVALAVDRPSIALRYETATLTATVTYSQSQPVPDGLTVDFSTDLGQLHPPSATTLNGQATTTFSSTVQAGVASVTASVGRGFDAGLAIEVWVPDITVDPSILEVTLDPGDTATRTLTVGNVGEADLNWSLLEVTSADWLSESLTGGTIPPAGETGVVVTFETAGLTSGAVYTTVLRISSGAAPELSLDVPVSLRLRAPDITLDPTFLRITLDPGDIVTRTLTVGNVGEADLNWSLVEVTSAGWLTQSLSGGTLASSGETDVVVIFDATGLTPGLYTTTVRINSDDPDEPQLDVPLRLLVPCCRRYLPFFVRNH